MKWEQEAGNWDSLNSPHVYVPPTNPLPRSSTCLSPPEPLYHLIPAPPQGLLRKIKII